MHNDIIMDKWIYNNFGERVPFGEFTFESEIERIFILDKYAYWCVWAGTQGAVAVVLKDGVRLALRLGDAVQVAVSVPLALVEGVAVLVAEMEEVHVADSVAVRVAVVVGVAVEPGCSGRGHVRGKARDNIIMD